MQLVIDLGDVRRPHDRIRNIAFRKSRRLVRVARAFRGDAAVDNDVRDVNTFWAEFAGHALRQRAQADLGHGQARTAGTAAYRGRGAGKNNRARAALEHGARRCATDEKTAKTADAPAIVEIFCGAIRDLADDEIAGIENDDIGCAVFGNDIGK